MTEVLIVAGVIGYLSGLVRMLVPRLRYLWSYASVVMAIVLVMVVRGDILLLEEPGPVICSGIAGAFLGMAVEAVVSHYTTSPQVIRRR